MRKIRIPKIAGALLMALVMFAIVPTMASAHCDTMDGPVISDAKKAIETNNSNYISKWVFQEDEKEIAEAFELVMKVRKLSPEAQELADQYFYENLVRIHRAGEGAPYTGVKPLGTPMEEAIIAADMSIEAENLSAFDGVISEDRMPGLQERFEKVLATKDFDVNDVEAGREFVESYVQFTHYAEGEEHSEEPGEKHGEEQANESEHVEADVSKEAHDEQSEKTAESLPIIPWSIAGLLFVTTLIFGTAYYRKTSK